MITEYIQEALNRAKYEMIEDDDPFYGEIPDLPGVWATGKTLEECREQLKEVVEGWILLSVRKGMRRFHRWASVKSVTARGWERKDAASLACDLVATGSEAQAAWFRRTA